MVYTINTHLSYRPSKSTSGCGSTGRPNLFARSSRRWRASCSSKIDCTILLYDTSPNENFEHGYSHSNVLCNIYLSKAKYFAPKVRFVSNRKPLQSQATSLMTPVLRRYITEYTDANSGHYPIRCCIIFARALECILYDAILMSIHNMYWWRNMEKYL